MAHPVLRREDAPAAPHADGRTRYADDLYTWDQILGHPFAFEADR